MVSRRGGSEWAWDGGKVVNHARHVVSCTRPRHLSGRDLMNVSYCLSKTTHKVSLSRASAEREACCGHRMSLHRAVSFTNTVLPRPLITLSLRQSGIYKLLTLSSWLHHSTTCRCGLLSQTEVAWSVCRSVCLTRSWTVQKRPNWSRCRLGYGWAEETVY